jgi:hypothetical protein
MDKKRMWRSGKVQACHLDDVGSHTGGVIYETFNLCRRSSTLVKVCQNSLIFLIYKIVLKAPKCEIFDPFFLHQ